MQHNSLPRLVHSNAQHILMSPSRYRAAVDLLPHQLIATKLVELFTFINTSTFADHLPTSRRLKQHRSPCVMTVYRKPLIRGVHGQPNVKSKSGFRLWEAVSIKLITNSRLPYFGMRHSTTQHSQSCFCSSTSSVRVPHRRQLLLRPGEISCGRAILLP
jgi:hypothetical protein